MDPIKSKEGSDRPADIQSIISDKKIIIQDKITIIDTITKDCGKIIVHTEDKKIVNKL